MQKTLAQIISVLLATLPIAAAAGTIGGSSPADGVFVLEDAEDLDRAVDSLGRNWLGTWNAGGGFEMVDPSADGLTLAPGQSPLGCVKFSMTASFGYIVENFGVPMPSEPGESTLTHPGDLSGFESLTFLSRHSASHQTSAYNVILECYPETTPGVYPKLYWNFSPPVGNTFEKVTLPLHQPDLVEDAGGHTVAQLLSRTRFLSFNYYVDQEGFQIASLTVHVDDIKIEPPANAGTPTTAWMLY